MSEKTTETLLTLTGDIVAAHVAHNRVEVAALPALIEQVYGALSGLGEPAAPVEPEYVPAVSVRNSIRPDALISLIDGKPYKMLKRHLSLNGLTPDQYRARYGLKPDYPMVSAAYSDKRRELAKAIGLGRAGAGRKPKGGVTTARGKRTR